MFRPSVLLRESEQQYCKRLKSTHTVAPGFPFWEAGSALFSRKDVSAAGSVPLTGPAGAEDSDHFPKVGQQLRHRDLRCSLVRIATLHTIRIHCCGGIVIGLTGPDGIV